MTHAWIIDRDHLEEPGSKYDRRGYCRRTGDEEGKALARQLKSKKYALDTERFTFRLYDDDGELYYTGRLAIPAWEGDEEQCYAPLAWAMADSGCTSIKYQGHPEMDCG